MIYLQSFCPAFNLDTAFQPGPDTGLLEVRAVSGLPSAPAVISKLFKWEVAIWGAQPGARDDDLEELACRGCKRIGGRSRGRQMYT